MICKYFLSFHRLPFHFIDCFHWAFDVEGTALGDRGIEGGASSPNLTVRRSLGERNITTQQYLFSIGDLYNKSPLSCLMLVLSSCINSVTSATV